MKPTTELILFLAHQGNELHIQVSQDGGNCDLRNYRITKDDGSSATAPSTGGFTSALLELRDMLAHYPSRVTINGAPVERRPFSQLAKLTERRYPDPTSLEHQARTLNLGPGCALSGENNAYTAGVAYRLELAGEYDTEPYYALEGNAHAHWHKLKQIVPVQILTPSMEQLEYLEGRSIDSVAYQPAVMAEAQRRIELTLEHPDAPKPWRGPVHHYHTPDPGQPGAPIAAHGTAVSLDRLAAAKEQPLLLSITHALYNHDAGIVPVADQAATGGGPSGTKPVEKATFAWLRPLRHTDSPNIHRVDGISLTIHVEEDTSPKRLPAPALLTGDPIKMRTLIGPETGNPEELATLMLQAHHLEEPSPKLAQQLLEEARIALTGRQENLRNSVKAHLDTLVPHIDSGEMPFTAASHDGSIIATITDQAKVR